MSLDSAIDRVKAVDLRSPFPVPVGDVAPSVVGALSGLEAGDWWVPGIRERAGGVLREVPEERLQSLNGARPYRIAPISLAPALRAVYAVGLADADPSRAVLVHLGPGSIADGALFEALHLAVLRNAKVLFLVNQPDLGANAPIGPQFAGDVEKLGLSFGIPVFLADRSDPANVAKSVRLARAGTGPQLILATDRR